MNLNKTLGYNRKPNLRNWIERSRELNMLDSDIFHLYIHRERTKRYSIPPGLLIPIPHFSTNNTVISFGEQCFCVCAAKYECWVFEVQYSFRLSVRRSVTVSFRFESNRICSRYFFFLRSFIIWYILYLGEVWINLMKTRNIEVIGRVVVIL